MNQMKKSLKNKENINQMKIAKRKRVRVDREKRRENNKSKKLEWMLMKIK